MGDGCIAVGPSLRRDKSELLLASRGCEGTGGIGPIDMGTVEKGRGLFISSPTGPVNGGYAGGRGGGPCIKGGRTGAAPVLYIGCEPHGGLGGGGPRRGGEGPGRAPLIRESSCCWLILMLPEDPGCTVRWKA